MIQILFVLILMISSGMFILMNHPLSLSITLMFQTLTIALFSGLITKSFWFSYSLFLIFLGGMLILFMYMTSIASNEIFNFSINKKFLLLLIFTIMFFLMIMIFNWDLKSIFLNKILNMENMNMKMMKTLIYENNYNLNKLFNFPTNLITLIMINYLFLTLIAVVKITNIFIGPLRTKS